MLRIKNPSLMRGLVTLAELPEVATCVFCSSQFKPQNGGFEEIVKGDWLYGKRFYSKRNFCSVDCARKECTRSSSFRHHLITDMKNEITLLANNGDVFAQQMYDGARKNVMEQEVCSTPSGQFCQQHGKVHITGNVPPEKQLSQRVVPGPRFLRDATRTEQVSGACIYCGRQLSENGGFVRRKRCWPLCNEYKASRLPGESNAVKMLNQMNVGEENMVKINSGINGAPDECVHTIVVDRFVKVQLVIPRELTAIELRALMLKVQRLFKISDEEESILPQKRKYVRQLQEQVPLQNVQNAQNSKSKTHHRGKNPRDLPDELHMFVRPMVYQSAAFVFAEVQKKWPGKYTEKQIGNVVYNDRNKLKGGKR
jgi:hypothetical protein